MSKQEEVSLISGEVTQDGRTLHVWCFSAELADPESDAAEGWANIQAHTALVPAGTVLVQDDAGFGPVLLAKLPDGTMKRAADFADEARRVL